MRKFYKLQILLFVLGLGLGANAQSVTLNASRLQPSVELTLSTKSGSFVEGSTFEVPILVNTKGTSINGVEVRITFDKSKLEVVKPSSGNSIIGVWVEPPGYDNSKGTVSYVGVIPNGITTEAGLIGTITFRAKSVGRAIVSFSSSSKILLNDGLGTESALSLGRAEYGVIYKAPEGVQVYSDTHPFQENWYRNNNPVLSWEKDSGVDGFSAVLDNMPNTIPESTINTKDTSQSFENLTDGLWYFHIKASRKGAWSTTGNFLLRIDTSPPAEFTPTVNYLLADASLSQRALISYVTTDNLSGIDHYEVGVIDKNQPTTVSPEFIEAEPPYQVPLTSKGNLHVIVRAVDKAGNIRDASVDVVPPAIYKRFFKDNLVYVLVAVIFIGLFGMILHYLFGHHIVRHFRRAMEIIKKEEAVEEIKDL